MDCCIWMATTLPNWSNIFLSFWKELKSWASWCQGCMQFSLNQRKGGCLSLCQTAGFLKHLKHLQDLAHCHFTATFTTTVFQRQVHALSHMNDWFRSMVEGIIFKTLKHWSSNQWHCRRLLLDPFRDLLSWSGLTIHLVAAGTKASQISGPLSWHSALLKDVFRHKSWKKWQKEGKMTAKINGLSVSLDLIWPQFVSHRTN